jgi:hypothetical protein
MLVGDILTETVEVGLVLGDFGLEFRDPHRSLGGSWQIYVTRARFENESVVAGSETVVQPNDQTS